MALIRPGGLLGGLSGGIGGIVGSRNGAGDYIRARTKPTVSTTPYAMNQKALFAVASQSWQGLTAAQRQAWNEWAPQQTTFNRIGQAITQKGRVMYAGMYGRMVAAGLSPLTVPPIAPAPAPLSSIDFTADIGAGDFEITYAPATLPANTRIYYQACVNNSPAINYVENYLRFIGTSSSAAASPQDPQTLVEARFGTLVVGQYVTIMASTFSTVTGLISRPVRADAAVVTT